MAVALAVAFVPGCLWSDSETYSAGEVIQVLSNHGFSMEGALDDQSDMDRYQRVFPGIIPERLVDIAEAREALPHGDTLVLAAFIFKTQDKASCAESNILGICLRKRNVVVVVREDYADAAREALVDLD